MHELLYLKYSAGALLTFKIYLRLRFNLQMKGLVMKYNAQSPAGREAKQTASSS